MAAVALVPRARPSAERYAPAKVTVVESLCSSEQSMEKARTALSTTSVRSPALSASKSLSRQRPSLSSFKSPGSPGLKQMSDGSQRAAHSEMA